MYFSKISNLNELSVSNDIEAGFQPKSKLSLNKFKKVSMTKEFLNKYKDRYKSLIHVDANDFCTRVAFMDGNKIVAYVSVDNYRKYIQGMEITKDYTGHGLSTQLLDYAVHSLGARFLSVNKKNNLAISIYKKYGFKTYKSDSIMLYMEKK